MTQPQVAPYGAWKSPITSALITSASVRLGGGALAGERVLWSEGRPLEGGRYVIVAREPDGSVRDLIPEPFNARTRVHEYGGGSWLEHDETVYFSNFRDQRLYVVPPHGSPQPLTPEKAWRYADCIADPARGRLICVREDHTGEGEAVNTLTAIPLDGGPQVVLASGHDFYASPRLSPDGSRLAWLTWDHPRMPWDGTELWVAPLAEDGSLGAAECVAGSATESIFQPTWSPDGVLTFVSDRSGWWNLYRLEHGSARALAPLDAEFGQPQWVFWMSTYGYLTPERIVCAYSQNGTGHLALLDLPTGQLTQLETPYTTFDYVRVADGKVLFNGGAPDRPSALVLLDVASGEHTVLRESSSVLPDAGYLTRPRSIAFPTEGGETAYGIFYPPHNQDYVAPEGELPPLIVVSHGGPTAAMNNALSLAVQYWTSRGFAVLEVNYGGSTGYGRAYRERLKGRWGIVDVDDCVNGAKYLVEQGLVDGKRMAIRGGSAGGYTTLCALTFRRAFQAGASHFGVTDLEALTLDTHKFESRYLDGLIGPYPERRDLYLERSPIHHVEGLNCPVIFFQGDEDKVVPPAQAEKMVAALREKKIPVAYLLFKGEQHGFRRAENIRRALDTEYYFYSRIFNFPPTDDAQPVTIENLD